MREQLDLNGRLHAQGMEISLPIGVTRALGWAVVAELLERNDELRVVELHPGGGQYDCLSVYTPSMDLLCHLNVTGSLTHERWFRYEGERITWLEVLQNGPEWAAGLIADIQGLERSTRGHSPHAIFARTASKIMSTAAIRGDLEMLSAVADSSSGGAVIREHLVAPYEEQIEDRSIPNIPDEGLVADGAYRYWFLTENEGQNPVACFDSHTAQMWVDPPAPAHQLSSMSTPEVFRALLFSELYL